VSMRRSQSVVNATLGRDSTCVRCGQKERLQVHHICALADGGEDAVDNTAALCGSCHTEWHNHGEAYLTFREFVKTIPVGFLLAVQAWGLSLDGFVRSYWHRRSGI
jgi:5-methylcytosine-specific restriction endonuclease McrA